MKHKALFLDRDGVINVEKNYAYKIEDFEFMDGIFEVLRHFQDKGYLLIVVTNQAGIGRGYYTEEDFHKLNNWMLDRFKQNHIFITKVYYCPYHPEFGIGEYKRESFDRKPNPGMILKAAQEFNLDLGESILVGDKESDIEAAISAKIGTSILLSNAKHVKTKADYVISHLSDLIQG